MTELAFDGSGALQMAPAVDHPTMTAPVGAPAQEEKTAPGAETSASGKPGGSGSKSDAETRAKWGWQTAPKAVATILILAVGVVLILVSYAQLVMANDEVISLRNQLTVLESEETTLMAKYELAYDLQEIETQMLASGQMTKIQPWQTYALELSEPDSVEYYQGWDLKENLLAFTQGFGDSLKEYFGLAVS